MPDLSLEQRLHRRGLRLIAGVDEAGRGPLAGPVVAAAVILPPDLTGDEPWLDLLDDSKRLSPAERERAVVVIEEHALGIGVAQVESQEIDRKGISPATIWAMMRAVANLPVAKQTCRRSLGFSIPNSVIRSDIRIPSARRIWGASASACGAILMLSI